MPAAARKGSNKKKSGKKSAKKGLKGLQSIAELLKSIKLQYELKSNDFNSYVHPDVKKLINQYAENNTLLAKFILTPGPAEELPVKVPPLVAAIRSNRYVHVKELYIWDIPMKHEDIATLALLLEQSIYPIQYLELMECSIDSYGVDRLARSICMSNLTALLLDYNKFGDSGCSGLCRGLYGNRTLLRLSLSYCNLGPPSGEILGKTISNTALRDIYLDGNFLECEGVIELIKLFADTAEMEAIERAEQKEAANTDTNTLNVPGVASAMSSVSRPASSVSIKSKPASARSRLSSTGKKGKKGKKKKSGKKKKEPPPPPAVGPWIQKLHLLNNGIDAHGPGSNLGPVMCMKMFRKLITHSEGLQELDLDDNLIGDLGGREILEALMDRKEAGLNSIKINVTHRMNSTTFAAVNKLGSGLKKKGKKKKGKPGKKRI
ncbi:uncharacterized protein LOC144662188 [Oculina patagonica]